MYEEGLRFKYMIKESALRKVKILAFWEKHGLRAAMDAYGVSRATMFLWQKKLKEAGGKLEALNNRSKVPKNKRKRVIPAEVKTFIIEQRRTHPKLGKEKINVLMRQEGVAVFSDSTVGRMIADLKKRGALPNRVKLSMFAKTGNLVERKQTKKRKKLRRKGYQPKEAGDLLQIDTIEKFINGIKRYVVTAIDLKSDFAFAYAYTSANSKNTVDFFRKLEEVAPFVIKRVQTDNGSEFEKYFREYIEKKKIVHYHNYPNCPKMNPFIERFNRTLQEEFINYRKHEWAYRLNKFNRNLMDYLLWYNTKRPHWSLGLKSPMQFIISKYLPEKSNMLWTDTWA